ncbi:hypothetical protein C8R44DRAFT_725012 [Mycena epipterygia]|nr:hypothetical protein C8R44DRAFT_725012 [Mycena epipterygia]
MPPLPATPAISPQLPPPIINTTISTPSPATRPISPPQPDPTSVAVRSAHVLPAAASAPPSVAPIPYVLQFVFDHYRQLLDDREEHFIASNDADDTLEGLLSLALQIGWQIGWEHGRESGNLAGKEDGRCEGITKGRRLGLEEATQLPPIVREFANIKIQMDTAAAIILLQESLPPLTVTADAITPPVVPIPRDFTALQTGSPHPFATNLSQQRRFHYCRIHAVDVSVAFSIGIVILFYRIWGEHWELLGGLEEVERVLGPRFKWGGHMEQWPMAPPPSGVCGRIRQ